MLSSPHSMNQVCKRHQLPHLVVIPGAAVHLEAEQKDCARSLVLLKGMMPDITHAICNTVISAHVRALFLHVMLSRGVCLHTVLCIPGNNVTHLVWVSAGINLPDWSVGAILVAGFLTMLLLDHLQQAMVGGGHAHAHKHTPMSSSSSSGQSIHHRHSHLSDEDPEEDTIAAQKV